MRGIKLRVHLRIRVKVSVKRIMDDVLIELQVSRPRSTARVFVIWEAVVQPYLFESVDQERLVDIWVIKFLKKLPRESVFVILYSDNFHFLGFGEYVAGGNVLKKLSYRLKLPLDLSRVLNAPLVKCEIENFLTRFKVSL